MRNREESAAEYRRRVARALAYIQDHLAGEISLEEAAAAACFSKYHFHRIFSAVVGESVADYVRRLRLERAANLLEKRPELSVTEVALASGFSSSSVFSRDFAAHFQLPPSRWRESRGGSGGTTEGEAAAPPSLEALAARFSPEGGTLSARRLPALRFASVLCLEGYGPSIGAAWERLFRWAGPRGLLGPRPGAPTGTGPRLAGVSWDNPEITPPKRCRYSACLELPSELEATGDILLVEFPARNYLVLDYQGAEPGLAAAYARLYRRHLPESGFEPEDAPAIEFYRRPPGAERLFDLEIAVPVRPLP